MSCVSNDLSPQVSLYFLTIITGNANAANWAQTMGRVCTTGYIGIMWGVLGFFLSGDMMSLKKHLVFLDCYRLMLGRASSCKTLL